MATTVTLGFESVMLVSGLAETAPVWLYMRATLFDEKDFSQPLWVGEVGSWPPDVNRPAPSGYPVGDAGRFAAQLKIGVEVGNSSSLNVPTFAVGPVTVQQGQALELTLFMLPKVWFETKVVSPTEAEELFYGAFDFLIATSGFGFGGYLFSKIFGDIFDPSESEVEVPCFNSVISARHLFTERDLKDIESIGRQRFGPNDNSAYAVCRQPIDSFYWLSVNNSGFQFAPIHERPKELCTLEPRAYRPVEDQFNGEWGDAGDRLNDCLFASIHVIEPNYARVYIAKGLKDGSTPIATFERVPIRRDVISPPFQRNVFDDLNCPARSVKPDCAECLRFVNLPAQMLLSPELLFLGLQSGSHVGTRPAFPLRINTDRITTLSAHRCAKCNEGEGTQSATQRDGRMSTLQLARNAIARTPISLNESLIAELNEDGLLEVWPNGMRRTRDWPHNAIPDAIRQPAHLKDYVPMPKEFGISWVLECSPEFTLSTYQEIRGETGCASRLRFTRRSGTGLIVADVMLSRLPAPIG